jgi:hypothetical protein
LYRFQEKFAVVFITWDGAPKTITLRYFANATAANDWCADAVGGKIPLTEPTIGGYPKLRGARAGAHDSRPFSKWWVKERPTYLLTDEELEACNFGGLCVEEDR